MININTIDQLDDLILDNEKKKILMLYFGSSWCGPCNKLKKKIDETIEMPNILVFYIDVDINTDISENYDITMLPTQVFIRVKNMNVQIIEKIEGYDWIKLLMVYNKIDCK